VRTAVRWAVESAKSRYVLFKAFIRDGSWCIGVGPFTQELQAQVRLCIHWHTHPHSLLQKQKRTRNLTRSTPLKRRCVRLHDTHWQFIIDDVFYLARALIRSCPNCQKGSSSQTTGATRFNRIRTQRL
jgi:hypothetical protein